MEPNGRARSETDVVDLSVVISNGFRGISAVIGLTQWGEVEKPKLISDWDEFILHFGGFDENWTAPVGTNFPLLCYRALNAGAKLYVARAGSYTTNEGVEELDGDKPTGTIGDLEFTGKYIGNYGVSVEVTKVEVAGTTSYAITEVPVGKDADYTRFARTVDQLPETLDTDAITQINNSLRFCQLTTGTTLTEGKVVLAGGKQDVTKVTNEMYIGNVERGTGFHALDETNFDYIAIPDKADPELDNALVDYVAERKDVRAILRCPVGISADLVIEYRNQTGTYQNAAGGVDSWLASMTEGGIIIKHPVTGQNVEISEIGDVLGRKARKDNGQYPWFTAAGAKRGTINCLGVVYNLGTNARAKLADAVDRAGVNLVINHDTYGPVIWGNSTLQRKRTLLMHENVADCIMYITKVTKPIIDLELFDPNDLDTWKTIYRGVKRVMDIVKEQRGVWDWMYQGDQDAASVAECVVNKPENIDAGMYVFYLWVQPKVGMKYVNMKVMVTNSGVSFEEMIEETQPQ